VVVLVAAAVVIVMRCAVLEKVAGIEIVTIAWDGRREAAEARTVGAWAVPSERLRRARC
jgi:hypothetical protein